MLAKGWVRTKRGNKQVKFIALNDGSTVNNIQVVAETSLFDEELIKKISPKKKLLKEKLLSKLLWGSIIGLLGISFLVYGLLIDFRGGMNTDDLIHIYFAGGILLAVGIAFLVNYRLSKKMLAKEIEAEEKLLVTEAENK